MMTSRDRVLATLRGDATDRPPVSFWGHVYDRECSAEDLVAHTLERQARHRWDWVKLNPRKHYHVEPWGVRYDYSNVPAGKPVVAAYPVHTPRTGMRSTSVRTTRARSASNSRRCA
jgi:uroporphyrinogen decarboxylase